MAQERVAYIDGEIFPESQAKISIRDVGFTHGDAVFDTTRTFGGEIFRLSEHLDRFQDSLKYMRLDPGLSKQDWTALTMQVLNANLPLLGENDDYWVTQRVTRGVAGKPSVIIECVPLPFEARAKFYRDGLPVIVPSVRRTPPDAMSPRAKVHNYINLVQAELEVKSSEPGCVAHPAGRKRQHRRRTRRQRISSEGRRHHHPQGAVHPRGHQPPDGHRSGAGDEH